MWYLQSKLQTGVCTVKISCTGSSERTAGWATGKNPGTGDFTPQEANSHEEPSHLLLILFSVKRMQNTRSMEQAEGTPLCVPQCSRFVEAVNRGCVASSQQEKCLQNKSKFFLNTYCFVMAPPDLKGQCQEIFYLWFFSSNCSS
jgi:hypothetical protein